jgi:hypothetical protein
MWEQLALEDERAARQRECVAELSSLCRLVAALVSRRLEVGTAARLRRDAARITPRGRCGGGEGRPPGTVLHTAAELGDAEAVSAGYPVSGAERRRVARPEPAPTARVDRAGGCVS